MGDCNSCERRSSVKGLGTHGINHKNHEIVTEICGELYQFKPRTTNPIPSWCPGCIYIKKEVKKEPKLVTSVYLSLDMAGLKDKIL